jgi:hypothetical protein
MCPDWDSCFMKMPMPYPSVAHVTELSWAVSSSLTSVSRQADLTAPPHKQIDLAVCLFTAMGQHKHLYPKWGY